MDELLGEFLTETQESLERLDVELVRFESEPNDPELLNNIFRLVHTVKGTCGFLGLDRLAKLTHAAESLMSRYRDGMTVSADGVSAILASLDRMNEILQGLERDQQEPAGSDDDLIVRLLALAEAAAPQGAREAVRDLEDQETLADMAMVRAGDEAIRGRRVSEPEEAEARLPDDLQAAGLEYLVAEEMVSEPIASEEAQGTDAPGREAAQSIRVKVDTLEHLMTTVSELVLARNQLLDIDRRKQDTEWKAPLHRLSGITNELQRGIMKARMLPIDRAWQKLPRMLRDLSVELGKSIELTTSGGETELDRQVLEFIRDPMTHLIRNAADHGIGTPARRRALGKSETGHIDLKAYAEGDHIVIEIGDDGRGLDTDRIKAKCIEKELLSETEIGQLGESEIHQFIFQPGFSTAAEVTDISGRGVGLDVVRANIEVIGGTVDLKSSSGQGTVFRLRIPLTLAIAAALIVETDGTRFAVPQHNVSEVVRAKRETDCRIEMINDAPQLRLRGRLLPVYDLGGLLHLPEDEAVPRGRLLGEMATVIVMEAGVRRYGLLVETVLRPEEIVVKPKASVLQDLTMFSGNTILGDGSVIMIIDPAALAALAGVSEIRADFSQREAETQEAREPEEAPVPLLLFKAGGSVRKAVPLALVARLEEIPGKEIEVCNEGDVIRYRDGLMPLLFMDGVTRQAGDALQPILVFDDEGRHVGLAIDEIIDVVEAPLSLEIRSVTPGLIGSLLVDGEVTELIDISYYIGEGLTQRLAAREAEAAKTARLLLVDDSQFFRNMLAPLLTAHGYSVTLAESAHEALEMKEEGTRFDLIISDLEMPGLDGFAFAQEAKKDPRWSETPLIALSSYSSPELIARSRAAGFIEYVGKFDRQKLMAALKAVLPQWGAAA
ncbi:chemotaxis protein CheW [Methyloligella sp. 2.7D]|uniref:hybrid sensor histidine kinase/response regulator n=1 Tax=unclassified Methyloligella TaxID=2625955 RepID=UPI00157E2494|nr:chemotaxis protein CheW [Methyloligella sp. GL2]QKP76920.1 chemotaxis protein CheW [Methyloligella sp. GL2]